MIFKDEAIWSQDIFKTMCESMMAKDWSIFYNLWEQYKDYSNPKRKSNSSKTLSGIGSIENALSEQFNSVAVIIAKSSIGINELVKNLTEKKSQILDVVKTLLQLQNKATAKKYFNSSRWRLKQMMATKNYTLEHQKIESLCHGVIIAPDHGIHHWSY